MTQQSDRSIVELLHASRDDQHTLSLPVSDRVFGFHAQQAVEKLLKALISAHDQPFAYIHDLARLTLVVRSLGEVLPDFVESLEALTDYAGVWRYEEPEPMPNSERARLLAAINEFDAFTIARLQSLRPSFNWSTLRAGAV